MTKFGNVEISDTHIRVGYDFQKFWASGFVYLALIGWGVYSMVTDPTGYIALILVLCFVVPVAFVQTGKGIEINGINHTITTTSFYFIRSTKSLSEFYSSPMLNSEMGEDGWYLGRKGDRYGKQIFLHVSTTKGGKSDPRFDFFTENGIPLITKWLEEASEPKVL